LPRAMILALVVCTILYIAITLVLTGMVNYKELAVGDPLAYVFAKHHLNWLSGIIGMGAIIAMASVLLVFQVGQPRIWMSMSRDGLLPKRFSKIHSKFKTPAFSTIITGVVVGIPSLFMNLTEVTDLTSIGTLFAFVIVCAGVLHFNKGKDYKGSFYLPYINAKYIVPLLFIVISAIVLFYNSESIYDLCTYKGGWASMKHKIPYLIFYIISGYVAFITFKRNYSLIPVLGLLTNLYLMTELGFHNWLRFLIWLILGLILYFTYGYFNSKLRVKED
jgi:basic amino acid/polyamine antiporter, APA family